MNKHDARSQDMDLVLRAQSGDRAAFGILAADLRPALLRFLRRIMANDLDAQDLAQETLVTAYLTLDRLRAPERFQAWVFGIAANLARMRWRQRQYPTLSLDDLIGGRAAPGKGITVPIEPSPELVHETQELAKLVRGAVNELPRSLQQAVLLYYFDGLTTQEAAAFLDVSVSALKVRLHRARTQLREILPTRLAEYGFRIPHPEEVPMVEVIIEEVLVGPSQSAEDGEAAVDHRVVMLREKERERRLPIWIGPFEADALAVHLTETAVARPLSHDLMVRLLEAGDMRVRRVVVNKVENETFYATIVVSTPNGEREVDARPSDALNLAVRAGVPIFAAEELLVMTTVSLTKDEEGRSQFHIEWQGRDGEPKKSANWSSLLDKERLERALSTRVPSHHQQAQQPEE